WKTTARAATAITSAGRASGACPVRRAARKPASVNSGNVRMPANPSTSSAPRARSRSRPRSRPIRSDWARPAATSSSGSPRTTTASYSRMRRPPPPDAARLARAGSRTYDHRMKRSTPLLVLVTVLVRVTVAPAAPPADPPKADLAPRFARAVAVLAADDMEGRGLGTAGLGRAADWIEARVRAIGLA